MRTCFVKEIFQMIFLKSWTIDLCSFVHFWTREFQLTWGCLSTMVKTRSSARVGKAVSGTATENGTSSELRTRLNRNENGHHSQNATYLNTSRQVSVNVAFAWHRHKPPACPDHLRHFAVFPLSNISL